MTSDELKKMEVVSCGFFLGEPVGGADIVNCYLDNNADDESLEDEPGTIRPAKCITQIKKVGDFDRINTHCYCTNKFKNDYAYVY